MEGKDGPGPGGHVIAPQGGGNLCLVHSKSSQIQKKLGETSWIKQQKSKSKNKTTARILTERWVAKLVARLLATAANTP